MNRCTHMQLNRMETRGRASASPRRDWRQCPARTGLAFLASLALLFLFPGFPPRDTNAGQNSLAIRPEQPRNLVSKGMIRVQKLKLKEPGWNNQLGPALVADDPTGGLWVSWRSGRDSNIQHMTDKLKADRTIITLENHAIMGLFGHDDGTLALTWYESRMNPEFGVDLYLNKISADGEQIWTTKFRGDPGANLEYKDRPQGIWGHPNYAGPVIPIAFNGKQYGLFYVIMQKFPGNPGECHTADEFCAVDADGTVDESKRHVWNASHSFWMSAVAGKKGDFYGITYASPSPFIGIRMGAYSRKPAKQELIWPATEWALAFDMPHTRLSRAFNIGQGFAMAISSGVDKELSLLATYDVSDVTARIKAEQMIKSAYPILLRFEEDGAMAQSTYLTTNRVPDTVVSGARFGKDSAIVAWGSGPGGMKGEVFGTFPVELAILDRNGSILQSPVEVDAPLTWHSDLTTLKNGDVAWAGIADDWTRNDDRHTLYIVRVECPEPLRAPGTPTATGDDDPAESGESANTEEADAGTTARTPLPQAVARIDAQLLAKLQRLAAATALPRAPIRVSMTKAWVVLAGVDEQGGITLRAQVEGQAQEARFEFSAMKLLDKATIAAALATAEPDNQTLQASVGFYLECAGHRRAAEPYYAKAGNAARAQFDRLFDGSP
jgi:hypothetical protein